MNRRKFIKLLAGTAAATMGGASAYGAVQAHSLQVTRQSILVPHLPVSFAGTTIALLADIHHSLEMPESYVHETVSTVNALSPDFIILGGDYITAGEQYAGMGTGVKYLEPCFAALSKLRASEGIFAVTGNHDVRGGVSQTNEAIARAGFVNLTNTGLWLRRNGERLRLCGIGDFQTQPQRLRHALGDATARDAVILVTHNPDYAEKLRDERVGLVLSGHTHGGQVVLPFIGAPIVPSIYGQKYRYGLVKAPVTRVFITSGVGTLPLAIRINCPPEVALITLKA